MHKKKKMFFKYSFHNSNSFAVLKSGIKSVFSKLSLKKFSTSKFFIWSEFLGAGGDENLIINFLWPNKGKRIKLSRGLHEGIHNLTMLMQ